MKDVAFSVSELAAKSRLARQDVVDLDALRKITVPADGTSFLVQRSLYIFMASDLSNDDGISSIRPESIPASKAGRYRRGALAFRQKA
jgi:hypothetical protein